jgi:prepilin-type processing-associated H-X9-DG protein
VAIIAILAAMLLPALAAAREKARRSTCLTNIKQTGTALESYCGDYSQYFPSWPGVGFREHDTFSGERGVYKDVRLGIEVDTLSVGGDSANWLSEARFGYGSVGCFRNIAGYGEHNPSNTSRPVNLDGVNGRMAPINLGYMLEGGYLNDFTILYCPSARGMDAGGEDSVQRARGYGYKGMESLDAIRTCVDSTSSEGLFYADYSANSWAYAKGSSWGYRAFIGCHYNYRPTIYGTTSTGSDNYWADSRVSLGGTKPLATGFSGSQIFPTQRALGARALITDTFQKSFVTMNSTDSEKRNAAESAAGMKAHGDGYNVVYGDGHAAWYGDPQQRFIWWEIDSLERYNTNFVSGVSYRKWMSLTPGPSSAGSHNRRLDGALAMWHIMDTAGGVDVEADWRQGAYPH